MNRFLPYSLIVFLFCLLGNTTLFAQHFDWVVTRGQTPNSVRGADRGYHITTDELGNIITAGWFMGMVDFDPGANTRILDSHGLWNGFISKSDSSGNLIWAHKLGRRNPGGSNLSVEASTVDRDGNVLVSGTFRDTVDFDPGPGRVTLGSLSYTSAFLVKFSPQGTLKWAIGFGNDSSAIRGKDIKTDPYGNVFLLGEFANTIDFDPDTSVFTLATPHVYNAFTLKLSSNGDFIWAKRQGAFHTVYPEGLELDRDGNIYSTGLFYLSADMDPGPGLYRLSSPHVGSFVSKLDSSGNFLWAKGTTKPRITTNSSDGGRDIILDSLGNIYVLNVFNGIIDFDSGPDTAQYGSVTIQGQHTAILRYAPDGTFLWAHCLITPDDMIGKAISTDERGLVYVSGEYEGIADFDPGPGTKIMQSNGPRNAFIQIVDTSGLFFNALSFGGTVYDTGLDIHARANGDFFVTGYYTDTVDFDPGPAKVLYPSRSMSDYYFMKFTYDTCADLRVIVNNLQDVTCSSPGYAEAVGYGGKTPYSFFWKNKGSTSNSISVPGKGIQHVRIQDNRGCIDSTSVLVREPISMTGTEWSVTHTTTTFRPGLTARAWVDVRNRGCLTDSNELCLIIDSLLEYQSSNVLPHRRSGDSLFWKFHGMNNDSGNGFIEVDLKVDQRTSTSHLIQIISKLNTRQNEAITSNNSDTTRRQIINSFDPNDIAVRPSGFCKNGIIHPDTTLRFRIRFQNTGTAEALEVEVVDSLPAGLDLSTLNLLSHSHSPMNLSIEDESVLIFSFPDINLPDSSSNEPESHGYIMFEIKPDSGILDGDRIENKVEIYFDYNDPVATNTTRSTMYRGIITDSVRQDSISLFGLQQDAFYQWINCLDSLPIPGANQPGFTPDSSGVFAASIDLFGCTFLTDCYQVTIIQTTENEPGNFSEAIQLYPNPTSGRIRLLLPESVHSASLTAFDQAGRQAKRAHYTNTLALDFLLEGKEGLYLLRLDTEKGTVWFKVIKENF